MSIDDEIKRLTDEIRQRGKFIQWLRRNRKRLEIVPEGATFFAGQLDLNGAQHKDTLTVIKAVGGKFKKTPGSNPNTINYTGQLDGVPVRVWCGQPPPSCRIVEVEEHVPEQVIPAHTVKVRKMVCAPELSAQIKIARDAAGVDAPSQPTV